MSEDADPKSLAGKVEDTIEGFLLFLIAYLRTLAVIAFRWGSGLTDIMRESPARRRYVYPFAFLAIGGFLFSVVVAAYPAGFLGIPDLIWFSDDISKNIVKNFDKMFSVTALLTGGFPTFIAVVILSGVAARIEERDAGRRAALAKVYRYLFGYQAAVLFVWLAVIIFLPASGFEPCAGAKSVCDIGIISEVASWAALLSFPFLVLVSPIGALAAWRWQSLSTRPRWRIPRVLASVALFGLIMSAYASLASVPARVLQKINPPPAASLALGSVELALPEGAPSTVTAVTTLKNPTDDALVLLASDLRGTLSIEKVEAAKWTVRKLRLASPDLVDPSVLTLGGHEATAVRILGEVDLTPIAQASLRERLAQRLSPVADLDLEFSGRSIAAQGHVQPPDKD